MEFWALIHENSEDLTSLEIIISNRVRKAAKFLPPNNFENINKNCFAFSCSQREIFCAYLFTHLYQSGIILSEDISVAKPQFAFVGIASVQNSQENGCRS